MKHLLLILATFTIGLQSQAQNYKYPVPRDFSNTPIYGPLGLPQYAAVAISSTSFADVLTLSLTGVDTNRQYRSICVFNPSTSVAVNICFGAACSTPNFQVPSGSSGSGLCLDNTYFGEYNAITVIRAALASGSTSNTPVIQVW